MGARREYRDECIRGIDYVTKRLSDRTATRRQRAEDRRREFFLSKDEALEASGDTERQGGDAPVPQDLPAVELVLEDELISPPLKKKRQEPAVRLMQALSSDASKRRGEDKRHFRFPKSSGGEGSRDVRVVSSSLTAVAGDSLARERELEKSGWKSSKAGRGGVDKPKEERERSSSRRLPSTVVVPPSSSIGKVPSTTVWIAGRDVTSSHTKSAPVTTSATSVSTSTPSSSSTHHVTVAPAPVISFACHDIKQDPERMAELEKTMPEKARKASAYIKKTSERALVCTRRGRSARSSS